MSTREMLETFERWREASLDLVLVTVVDTEGSTYTKAGHRILIAANGEFRGLVSGGCLEGDLAEHARGVLADNATKLLTYDLRDENDDLWGLGIGCNGLFRILLQPLLPGDGYGPFAAIAQALRGDEPGTTATVIESDDGALPPGATVVVAGSDVTGYRIGAAWSTRLTAGCRGRIGAARAQPVDETLAAHRARVLYAPLRPLLRLLVLGAGLDAVPLVDLAWRLGWRVTIADHRPAYLARGDLAAAEKALLVEPERLASQLPLARFSAVVIMSHHLATDRAYLRALAPSLPPYVGVLGPAARGARLLDELGAAGHSLRGRLHSPVGLAIGANSPESIALAILAEIHAALESGAGRSGDNE